MEKGIAGALVVLVAATVGAGVGYGAAVALRVALFDFFVRLPPGYWAYTLSTIHARMGAVFVAACIVLGAVGGVFLGMWLLGRLFGAGRVR